MSKGVSTTLVVAAVVAIIVVAGVAYFVFFQGGSNRGTTSSRSTTSSVQPVSCVTGQSSAGATQVSISSYSFSSNVTIKVGQSVQWTNNDPFAHTVTSYSGLFHSGDISPGSTFLCTFSQAGTFTYHCSIHTYMIGSVKVES